jgi:hypothetical protein
MMTAITAARIEARAGKVAKAKPALIAVIGQAKMIGIPEVQFEARLAQGETAFLAGDQVVALSLLSSLESDAARKGFKQIESRAENLAHQISSNERTATLGRFMRNNGTLLHSEPK